MNIRELSNLLRTYPLEAEVVMPDMMPVVSVEGHTRMGYDYVILSDRKPVTDGADDEE